MKNFVVSLVQIIGVGNVAKIEVTRIRLHDILLPGQVSKIVLEVKQLRIQTAASVGHYRNPVAELVDEVTGEIVHNQNPLLDLLSSKNPDVFCESLRSEKSYWSYPGFCQDAIVSVKFNVKVFVLGIKVP